MYGFSLRSKQRNRQNEILRERARNLELPIKSEDVNNLETNLNDNQNINVDEVITTPV
jgi:hypothetical protein